MNDTGDNTVFFGEPWIFVSRTEGARRVETPIGQPCSVCAEPIAEGDRGYVRIRVSAVSILGVHEVVSVHAECEALGVVGHLFGVCSCTGHDTTSRASARLLWDRLSNLAYGHADDQH